MKLSRYSLIVPDFPESGQSVVFNTCTQAIIKIDTRLKTVLQQLPVIDPDDLDYFNQYADKLESLEIIVEDEKEENRKITSFFENLKNNPNVVPFEVTILTTYNCNFSCTYCFEAGASASSYMDKETTHQTIQWIKERTLSRGYKQLFLVFYGGEPLLNMSPIEKISKELFHWCKEEGITYYFTIITNGSLLTRRIVETLKPIGLRSVRVTLDGTKAIHNRRRPFKGGSVSFDVILENIEKVVDLVDVYITSNYDEQNYENLYELLDYLEKRGVIQKIKQFVFAPVVPRLGEKGNPSGIQLGHCLDFFGENSFYDKGIDLNKELIRRGFDLNFTMAINSCSLIMEDGGVVIDPKGVLYKCPSLLGHEQFSIGHVKQREFNEMHHTFLSVDAWKKCPRDCAYLPMCGGGCRLFAYFENKDFSDVCCRKELFSRLSLEFIKMDYLKQLKLNKKKEGVSLDDKRGE